MNNVAKLAVLVGCCLVVSGCGRDNPPNGKTPTIKNENEGTDAASNATSRGIPTEHFDRIVALFNRGVGLMDQAKATDAAKTFEEIVQLAPRWTTARVNLGIALLNTPGQAQLVSAEQQLKRAIGDSPNNPYAHYALGMLLRHLTRFEQAQRQFERVLEIDPSDADAHFQLGTLVAGSDAATARKHLEITLDKVPHHESACYRLQSLLREAGEKQRAAELLARFQSLKASGTGVSYSMKYGQMGRYAEVIRKIDVPASRPRSMPPLEFNDVAGQAGLTVSSGGDAGWPGKITLGSESFGPGVAVADVNGDGYLDIYIPGASADIDGTMYLNEAGQFRVAVDTGIDGRGAVGAFFGDYDADGDPDLYLTCDGPNRLYRNDSQGQFSDVTQTSGTGGNGALSVGACWADTDHDGDLDLYVANFSSGHAGETVLPGAPNMLWRNNGDDSFTNVAIEGGVDGGNAATVSVAFFDIDADRDLDLYVINYNGPNELFLNDRIGQYRDATSKFPELVETKSALGVVLGDLNRDGLEDLLLLRGEQPPQLMLRSSHGPFVLDDEFAATVADLGGATGALLGDFDLDGYLDVLLTGAEKSGEMGHYLILGDGAEHFTASKSLSQHKGDPVARGAVCADFDSDGMLEFVVARAGKTPEFWRCEPLTGRRWLEVIPTRNTTTLAKRPQPNFIGLAVEVKAGVTLQVASIVSSSGYLGSPPARAHFGLANHGKADYVRLTWPDSVLQGELEVNANQCWQVAKVQRKASSCPILFSHNGQRFEFVTDLLGVGGLGFFLIPGVYASPDPDEDILIPSDLIAPQDGRYLLRLTEPLEEATYLDQLHLVLCDHPSEWEVYPDERFSSATPHKSGNIVAIGKKNFPVSARDDRGKDVLPLLLATDRQYVEPPVDRRFYGYAADHWIELDFGDQFAALESDERLVLCLNGWTEYTYSHVNYAAHQAGITMRPPQIEIPDGNGGWKVAIADAGFPAGLPRMMTLDISSLRMGQTGGLRIRTNMQVFWDQIFAAVNLADSKILRHVLKPEVAQLRSLGYPHEYSPDGQDPTKYDYHRLAAGVAFKTLSGHYTRFGDVRSLLAGHDDEFVIMGPGEEIVLEFDATALPDLPQAYHRTLILHSVGYCKDMDLYTAFPDTIEPLPYRAMKNYPPSTPQPPDEQHDSYRRRWNTRHVRGQ